MIADRPSEKRKRPRRQNIARFVIRVAGERRWQWEPSYEAMILIEKTLKQLLAERKLELDLSHLRTPKQAITAIDLFEVELDVPMDGAQAYREGLLREENPFKWGTSAYLVWRRAYDQAKSWDVREKGRSDPK